MEGLEAGVQWSSKAAAVIGCPPAELGSSCEFPPGLAPLAPKSRDVTSLPVVGTMLQTGPGCYCPGVFDEHELRDLINYWL